MAAVRIEGEAFSDDRYDDLAVAAGLADADHARGKMAKLWRQCTIEQTHKLLVSTVVRVLGTNGVAALVAARLGELTDDGRVRIRGTKGRIEWLKRLRENGRKGGRPKKQSAKPSGFAAAKPAAYQESNPLTLATAPALSPALAQEPELRTPKPPSGVRSRSASKGKPSEPTDAETASIATVLGKLSAKNGIAYAGSAEHTRLILGRLRDGVAEHDLRKVIAYCADELGWKDDPKMLPFLRPETLFGPKTIAKYLDPARTWYSKLPDARNHERLHAVGGAA